MKISKIITKLITLLLVILVLTSCTFDLNSSNNNNTNNNNNNNFDIAEEIKKEYSKLVNGETDEHTVWEFDAYIFDMSATNYKENFKKYEVNMVCMLSDINIGIFEGQVNGQYPDNIKGLNTGIKVTIRGIIDENKVVESGKFTSDIAFSLPEIKWDGMVFGPIEDIIPPNPDDGGNDGDDVTPPIPDGSITVSKVNFAMINDTHGAFTDSTDGYSIARVDTLLDGLEDKNGDYIKIANGDIFQGSYVSSSLYGLPLVKALNEMDFDAFVLGNHEFDWGLDKIAVYKDGDSSNGEANFPFLGANIYLKGTSNRPDWIDPYTIVDYSGVKVGIIGLIGGTQESSILAANVADYEFADDIVPIVKKYSKELRNEKDCDVVVVASHDYDKTLNTYNSIAAFSNDERIDAIFCAHTHQKVSTYVTRADGIRIPVVQNYHKNNTVQEVVVNIDETGAMSSYSSKEYYISTSLYEMSSDLNYLMEEYKELIEISSSILGTVNGIIDEKTIGSYATKSMLDYKYNVSGYEKIDIAIMNDGGVRAGINEDGQSNYQIAVSDVFNSIPFNNKIVLLKLKGSDINNILRNTGLFYTSSVSSFSSNTYYNIAVIDYVYTKSFWQNKGFKNATNVIETDILMRDLVVEYMDNLY